MSRFALSLDPVVTGIPPSFVDLFEKSVEAAKSYRSPTEAEVAQLRDLAAKSRSLFKSEEDAVAAARRGPIHPDSPHEDREGSYA